MNLLLGILSLVFCTGFGYYLSSKYTVRKIFYNDFYSFNKTLKSEVSFMQNSLISIIKKYLDKKGVFYKQITKKFLSKESVELDKKVFAEEEIKFFNEYLDNLGGTDKHTQMNFLQSVDSKLSELSEKTKEDEKKYKNIYIKMGFLIGLIALIILL